MGKVTVKACAAVLSKKDKSLELSGKPVVAEIGKLTINRERKDKIKDAADDMII